MAPACGFLVQLVRSGRTADNDLRLMSLKRYIEETDRTSLASEIGFYTPLATHIFGALLGYPPKHRVINKSGKLGIPDIRLYSGEDNSEWAVVEAKLDDSEIRDERRRQRIWREQILKHGYIGPETFHVILCAPRSFYVCDLEGKILEALHIEPETLADPLSGAQFEISDRIFRGRLHIVSYAASQERRQFEAFRRGELKSGHITLTAETLEQLQSVFTFSIEKLREYCRIHFRELRREYDEALRQVEEIDRSLDNIGSGAVKTRQKLLYRRRTIHARHRLAFQLFEDDFERFKHDQTYAGTQQEEHFEDIFCTNTAYVALSRLFFVRIGEDVGLTTRKISNSGIAAWRDFVQNIKGNYQDLLEVAFKDVAHVYSSLFEASVFDWFGKGNGELHDILERILYRLNAFSFRDINRNVLGSIYQYFRPRVERRRLGEYYTPVEVVDYILARTGIATDAAIMCKRILDPACGSFTFGVRISQLLLKAGAHLSPANQIDLVRTCVRGQDINPFSAFLSHLSLLFALLEVYLKAKDSDPYYTIAPMDVASQNSLTIGIPSARDLGSVDELADAAPAKAEAFDYVVGNPPFVRNERLPLQDREVLNDLFGDLAVRNTDLSVYFLFASVRYFAKEGGTIGMVAPIGIANTQMAAYLRNVLKDYEIFELVSLEWCAKQVFPGADIVPMLIFVRRRQRQPGHKICLVRGITTPKELKECIHSDDFLARRSSVLEFEEWAHLSALGDWCLEVSEKDVPILRKLNAQPSFDDSNVARCSFAIKAGNQQRFLGAAEAGTAKSSKVPFVKGQHIGVFHVAKQVDEYADLAKIDTAEDSSIWSDLDFYETNRGKNDTTGLGRSDYRTPRKLPAGSPSDTLCCMLPEIYVTLSAAVADPLEVAANNSVIVLVPKKYSAYCLAAIVNSRISRYYAFLTLRSAILLRRRTTWFPRAIKALRMPKLSAKSAKHLHDLGSEASRLSADLQVSEVQVYEEATLEAAEFKKAGFLGVQTVGLVNPIEREDLAAAAASSGELAAGESRIIAPSPDLLTLIRVALLAADKDEFNAEDIESILLPASESEQADLASRIRNFKKVIAKTQDRVGEILEAIDEAVAEGLSLTPLEHAVIRGRCQEFPLSVTVERPRFAWSADRKNQARRSYLPGERFK